MPKKKTEEQKPSGFAKLLASTTVKEVEVPTKKKSDKPVLVAEGDTEENILDEFCATKELFEVTKSRMERTKQEVIDFAKPKYLQLCIETGCSPDTPKLTSGRSSLNFQCKKKSKHELPKTPDGETITIRETLTELGFEEAVIKEIEDHVIVINEEFRIKPLSTLQEGTKEEKALCDKLSELITENFSQAEIDRLIERFTTVSIDDSWKDRAIHLACRVKNQEQRIARLDKLYNVIPVSFVPSHMKTTMSLDDVIKKVRSLGEEPAEEKVLESGNYRAKIKGNVVEMFMCAGKKETLLGEKKCDNAGHAQNFVAKCFRDPEYMAKQISEWEG